MEVLFLGTGSGRTSLTRKHTSLLFSINDYKLLIDCCDGISRMLLENGVDFLSITSIIITHFHPDHIGGISNLLNQMKMLKRKNALKIYIHKNLLDYLQKLLEYNYVFLSRFPFDVLFVPLTEDNQERINNDIKITAKRNTHVDKYSKVMGIDCSYLISLSFLLNIDEKIVLYSGDVGSHSDLFLFKKNKIDFMILESTHIVPEEIMEVYNEFNPSRLLLTHIDSESEHNLINWYSNLDKKICDKIVITYDSLKVEL